MPHINDIFAEFEAEALARAKAEDASMTPEKRTAEYAARNARFEKLQALMDAQDAAENDDDDLEDLSNG